MKILLCTLLLISSSAFAEHLNATNSHHTMKQRHEMQTESDRERMKVEQKRREQEKKSKPKGGMEMQRGHSPADRFR